jgi:demethylmenaquinone methyltransferase/2-methoxy-6-polyprenyl-1,4-benzoquinol methylase
MSRGTGMSGGTHVTAADSSLSPQAPMETSVPGATPRTVSGEGRAREEAASKWVRGMFGGIARHYDLLNHLLSFNLDRRWRARTVRRVADVLARPGARVLDLCCGTGDVLLSLDAERGAARDSVLLGSDFCHPMLIEARRKIIAQRKVTARGAGLSLFEADALALPLADNSLDLITVAFGFRNLANYGDGLLELRRALKPGGVLAILEFSQPTNRAFAAVYDFFSARVLPAIGGMISGSREAYSYLPESIRKFPGAERLAEQMRAAGFSTVEFERMTFGAVALHLGKK